MMMLLFGVDTPKCEEAALELSEAKAYTLTLTASVLGGYESNPTQLGEDLTLPKGQSARGFGFFSTDDRVDFEWQSVDNLNQLYLSYEYTQVFFEGLSGTDEGDHEWNAQYRHVFNNIWSGVLTTDDTFVTFDGHSFSNKIWIYPEIDWQPTDHYKTKVMSKLANYETFFLATIPERDPTANSVSFEVYEEVGFGKDNVIKITPGFLHIVNNADGSDYDYDRNRLQIQVKTNFNDQTGAPWKYVNGTLKFIHDFDRYDNPNSHARFAFARRDDRNVVDLQLSYDLLKDRGHIQKFSLIMGYKYVRNNSNLPDFNYKDHIITAGCSLVLQ
jgi:hypothetical protein